MNDAGLSVEPGWDLPDSLPDEDSLNELMTRPSPELVAWAREVSDPLLVLGAGGKMGPTLAVLAKRAADAAGRSLEVIAVSRYSDVSARRWLESEGVTTLSFDLLQRDAYGELPKARDVIYMVGLKFGTAENPSLTWAMNTLVPAYVAEHFRSSRIVALSTGNVYPMVPVTGGGSVETDPLTPLGEYGNACVARERLFEHFSSQYGTPVAMIRLNYAVDLRYGVLVDIALKVQHGQFLDVANGYLNCIWQGDANEMTLRSLALTSSPPRALNLTYPQVFSVRSLAEEMGKLLGRRPELVGKEADTAYLSNPALICRLLGVPRTPIPQVMRWTAGWIQNGGRLLGKPTHFEVRNGDY